MQKRSDRAPRQPGQDRRYDGQHVLVFEHAALRSGDIVLTMNAMASSPMDRAKAKIISTATRGAFSHALMCTTPPTLIEAIGEGVSNISSLNCFAHHPDYVQILRHSDTEVAAEAGKIAATALGVQYDFAAAVASILPFTLFEQQSKVFCSALVAAAYKAAGATEFANVNPYKITPTGLAQLGLQDVTRHVLRVKLAPRNVETMSALDGDRTVSPMADQAALLNGAFLSIKPHVDIFCSDLNRPPPKSFLECLTLIEDFFGFAKTVANEDEAIELVAKLQQLDETVRGAIPSDAILKMMKEAEALDARSLQSLILESFRRDPDIDIVHILGMLRTSEEQYRMRFEGRQIMSSSGKEWIRVQHSAEPFYRKKIEALKEVCHRLRSAG